MQGTIQEDLRQFREFLIQKVDHESIDMTPEEVLDQWRTAHPLPDELQASAAEIQKAIDEMPLDAGVPAREASANARRSLGLRVN